MTRSCELFVWVVLGSVSVNKELSCISENLLPSGHVPVNTTSSTDRKTVIAAALGTPTAIILFLVTVGAVVCLWKKCMGLRKRIRSTYRHLLPIAIMDQPDGS